MQIVRPHGYFDDMDDPRHHGPADFASRHTGILPVQGSMLRRNVMTTEEDIALKLCMNLLQAAPTNNADLIATPVTL